MNSSTAPTRIIVGIGDDESGDTTFAAAISEAQRLGAEVVAVRTWGPLADPTPRDALPPGVEEELADQAIERVDHAVAAAGDIPSGVRVNRRVMEGPAGAALVATADHDADVIMIGRSRHHLARRAVFGSVPDYVMDHATCPVIILPGSRKSARPKREDTGSAPAGIFY